MNTLRKSFETLNALKNLEKVLSGSDILVVLNSLKYQEFRNVSIKIMPQGYAISYRYSDRQVIEFYDISLRKICTKD